MTLKQIEEHFKDAKIIEELFNDDELYDITKRGSFDMLGNGDIVYNLDTSQNDYTNIYIYSSTINAIATIIENK